MGENMDKNLKRFVEKKVLITGAATGIGRATACRFAGEGADVVVCDIKEKELHETAAMVRDLGQKSLALVCDISKLEEVQAMLDAALSEFGQFHILFNNAGIGDTNAYYEDIDSALWDRIYAINVKGPFFICQRLAKVMIDNNIKEELLIPHPPRVKPTGAEALSTLRQRALLSALPRHWQFSSPRLR